MFMMMKDRFCILDIFDNNKQKMSQQKQNFESFHDECENRKENEQAQIEEGELDLN